MMNQQIVFGTDGWRGLLGRECTGENVAAVAQAFADYLNAGASGPTVAIGYDGRQDSRSFAGTCARVLNANGIEVHLSGGIVPTPVLSFYVREMGLSGGVMVTASHNPPDYNGIKFKSPHGGPLFTEETRNIEGLLFASPVRIVKGTLPTVNFLPPYRRHLEKFIDFSAIRRSPLPPILDSMAGAGGTLVEEILRDHGLVATTIFGTPDEQFAGRLAEPIERNLLPLRQELARQRYSTGLATDGDADRLGVILDTGEWLSAQETILLLADYIKRTKKVPGDLVKTSSVTDKLRGAFESPTCHVHEVQVGFKYISEKMIAGDIAFGGEESGGFGYKGHIPERDGILSALLMIEMLAVSGRATLSELVAIKRREFGPICYDRIDHTYRKPDRNEIIAAVDRALPSTLAGFRIRDRLSFTTGRGAVNGLKVLLEGETRWLLMRSSETEPLVRLYAEGQTNAEVEAFLQAGLHLLELPSEHPDL